MRFELSAAGVSEPAPDEFAPFAPLPLTEAGTAAALDDGSCDVATCAGPAAPEEPEPSSSCCDASDARSELTGALLTLRGIRRACSLDLHCEGPSPSKVQPRLLRLLLAQPHTQAAVAMGFREAPRRPLTVVFFQCLGPSICPEDPKKWKSLPVEPRGCVHGVAMTQRHTVSYA